MICIPSSLQTALAVGDVKDVKEIAIESRSKLQVDQISNKTRLDSCVMVHHSVL